MFDGIIDERKERMLQTLQELLQIESVLEPATAGRPFGQGPAHALEYVLNLALTMGFQTKNVDGFAGHVEYGSGEEYVAVLSHLDVVPAGNGWTHPPFGAEIVDGKVFARGAIDDKGPALSTLWALYALKEAGIRPKRKIRLIFGLDEESNWRCMIRYFQTEPFPLGGFTPDADFPLIYAEKGVATLRLAVRADQDSMCPRVVSFEGGHRVNMVPDYAYAVVDCHSETAAMEWEQKLYRDAKARNVEVEVSISGSRVQIVVHGVSAHGSTPDQGVNAVIQLAGLLSMHSISNASMWRAVASQDVHGRGLGIESEDAVTGQLTSNLGRANLENNTYAFLFNIRYPIDLTADEILGRCQGYVSDKWEVTLQEDMKPLYVPPDSLVVRTLSQVYQDTVGESAAPLAIGGATYARAIPNAVAFGPLFPGQEGLAHERDEYWAVSDYFRCIRIYAHAMMELGNIL